MSSRRPAWTGCSVAAWTVVAALTAVYVHLAVRLPGGPDGMSDLHVYLGAVRLLGVGGSLYDFVSFNGDRFAYPPVAGLLFAPFLVGSEPAARVAWTLLQCLEVVVLAWAVAGRASGPGLARLPGRVAVPGLAGLLMLSQPVFTGLFLGQVSLLVTLLAVVDALGVTPRRWRGVATGVAAAIKLTPLVFVPHLWLTGRRRAAVSAAVAFVALSALGGLVDARGSRTFWSSLSGTIDFVDLAQLDNQSVRGLLARAGWSGAPAAALLVVVVLGVGGLAYRRGVDLHRRGQPLAAALVVAAFGLLASPISWSHHQTPLVLAAACWVSGSRRLAVAWAAGVLVVMSVPFQVLAPRLRPPGHLLTEDLVLLLALAVATVIPFGDRASGDRTGPAAGPGGRSARDEDAERVTGGVGVDP